MESTVVPALLMGFLTGLAASLVCTLLTILVLCAAGKLELEDTNANRNSPKELCAIYGGALILAIPGSLVIGLCLFGTSAALIALLTSICFNVIWAALCVDNELRKQSSFLSLDRLKNFAKRALDSCCKQPSELSLKQWLNSVCSKAPGDQLPGGTLAVDDSAATIEVMRNIQQQIDRLWEWANLPSEKRAERVHLVGEVQSATERLTGAVGNLRKREADSTGIAFHVEGLKRYPIPADLIAGLEATLASVRELVCQQKAVVQGDLEAICLAREALTAHQSECAAKKLSVDEALALASSVLSAAEEALTASEAGR